MATTGRAGEADHRFELLVFGRLSTFQLIKIDLEIIERDITFDEVDRTATKGGDVVKGFQTLQFPQNASELIPLQPGHFGQAVWPHEDVLAAAFPDQFLHRHHHLTPTLRLAGQEIEHRWGIAVDSHDCLVGVAVESLEHPGAGQQRLGRPDRFASFLDPDRLADLIQRQLDRVFRA